MNIFIGLCLGISISSFYWAYKFKQIEKEINSLIQEKIREKIRYQSIIESYAKQSTKGMKKCK